MARHAGHAGGLTRDPPRLAMSEAIRGVRASPPAYQDKVQSSGKRQLPDVAFDADPSTGVAIYDTDPNSGQPGWWEVGGTSVGAPSWSGILADVDQLRAATAKAPLTAAGRGPGGGLLAAVVGARAGAHRAGQRVLPGRMHAKRGLRRDHRPGQPPGRHRHRPRHRDGLTPEKYSAQYSAAWPLAAGARPRCLSPRRSMPFLAKEPARALAGLHPGRYREGFPGCEGFCTLQRGKSYRTGQSYRKACDA